MSGEERIEVNKERIIQHAQWVTLYLIVYDVCAVTFAYFAALCLRFDFRFSMIPEVYLQPWLTFAPIYAVLCVIVFALLRLYRSIWRFASFMELQRVALATVITTIIHIIGISIALQMVIQDTEYEFQRMPFSYYIMGAIIQFVLIVGIRFSYRFILLLRASKNKENIARVMMVGVHSIIGTT